MEFQNPYFDGIASIIIGLILISISVLLARESRSLLMGESADAEDLQAIVALVEADEATWKVDKPMSMYLAPEENILLLPVVFQENISSDEVSGTIQRLREKIQAQFPAYKQVFFQPEVRGS